MSQPLLSYYTNGLLVIAADGLYKRDVFRMFIRRHRQLINLVLILYSNRLPGPLCGGHYKWRTDEDDPAYQENVEPILE